jgi:hypothetical protein
LDAKHVRRRWHFIPAVRDFLDSLIAPAIRRQGEIHSNTVEADFNLDRASMPQCKD